jgi:hypothetical protein
MVRAVVFALLIGLMLNDREIPGGDYRRDHIRAWALNLYRSSESDQESRERAWRIMAAERLLENQSREGSWGSEADATERDAVLANGYAVLALVEIRKGLR